MTIEAAKTAHFTMVFEGDIADVNGNPFRIETPYGKPVAVGRGNAFDKIDDLEAALGETET